MTANICNVVFFVSIFFCIEAVAKTPQWMVQPNVCITKSTSDSCQLTIQITTQHIPESMHCLFLDQRQISCSKNGYFNQTITLSIKQNSQLEIKNKAQQSILTQPLSIKYQDAPNLRRRIRNPWSLF